MRRPPDSGWGPALGTAAAATGLVATSGVSLALVGRSWPATTALTIAVGMVVVLTGLALTLSPRGRRTGTGLLAVGALWPTATWGMAEDGVGPFLAWTIGGLIWLLLGMSLLRYPADLPMSRAARRYVVVLFTVLGPLNAVAAVVSRPEWTGFAAGAWWPTLVTSYDGYRLVAGVYALSALALGGAAVALAAERLQLASGVDRVALLPAVVGVGIGAVIGAGSATGQILVASPGAWATMVDLQSVALLALPVAVVVSSVRARLTNSGIVDMVSRLTRPATPEAVETAVRLLLHDPSATVLFWSPERAGYIDGDGEPVQPPPPGSHMVVDVQAGTGAHLALVAVDLKLQHHARLVESAVIAVGLALENAWLQAQLYAQLGEVRASRSRILDVQLRERRRLGRNLHDGAQQNLLALSMRLEAARTRTADARTARELTEIKEQLRGALTDIRSLARGLHPPVLTQAGLSAAVAEMVERWPMPVSVDLPAERLDAMVEAAAYFIVSEALANVDKHAAAGEVRVSGRHVEGDFVLSISDDGRGGADPGGPGLRGIADRTHALGGTFLIASPPGGGTRIDVRIPCP